MPERVLDVLVVRVWKDMRWISRGMGCACMIGELSVVARCVKDKMYCYCVVMDGIEEHLNWTLWDMH